jgi:DMATS type aromatic prenyltransferase
LDLSEVQSRNAAKVFKQISDSWGDGAVNGVPLWPSDITDDGTPFEFSVAFEKHQTEIRMLFESQTQAALSNASTWEAGIRFGESMRDSGMADLSLFERVRHLFTPSGDPIRFSLWHGAVLRDGRSHLFKAYLNPEIEGPTQAHGLVDSALERLDLRAAREFVHRCIRQSPSDTRIPYFSLDLERRESARVKIYFAAKTESRVTQLFAGGNGIEPDHYLARLRALTGGERFYETRPVLVCASFRAGAAAPELTMHVPVRSFARDDDEAADRVTTILGTPDGERMRRAIQAVSNRPVTSTRGVLTYASLRQSGDALRVTVYLAPQLYTSTDASSSGTHAINRNLTRM